MVITTKRFRVALSFPGEKRAFIKDVADCLARQFDESQILYDMYHEEEFNRYDLGVYLPKLYHDESDICVAFLCEKYAEKDWCGLEWHAIHDLLKQKYVDRVMFFRFDDADIPGLYGTDGYSKIEKRPPQEIADLILKRYHRLHP